MKYSCDFCGRQYEEIARVKACETRCKKAASKDRVADEQREEFRNYIRLNLADIRDLPDMAREHYRKIGCDLKFTSTPTCFNVCVSNTHACPLNGVLNFHRDPDEPTGYPGWVGNWSGTLKQSKSHLFEMDTFTTSFLETTFAGFHSGCGGGDGEYTFRYSGFLFLADFPKLAVLSKQYDGLYAQYTKYRKDTTDRSCEYNIALREALLQDPTCVESGNRVTSVRKQLEELIERDKAVRAEFVKKFEKTHGTMRQSKLKYDHAMMRMLETQLGMTHHAEPA